MNFQTIQINPLDSNVEKFVKKNLNLIPPESYAKMNTGELDKLYIQVINSFAETKTKNFTKEIILSIRATQMRTHMILHHKNLTINKNKIITDYNNGINILELSKKYDGSPLNLLRIIFQSKYNTKLTKLIKHTKLLSKHDSTQLNIAINNDAYALVNQDEVLKKADEFEKSIEIILKKLKIKYKTQKELAVEQTKESDKPSNTPDFLILDDLYINGKKINWIDAKNFYGSNSKFIKLKIIKQTKKYIDKWGFGSIIFNLGFCSDLSFESILLIDYDSFKTI
jgi:hypothetical protein